MEKMFDTKKSIKSIAEIIEKLSSISDNTTHFRRYILQRILKEADRREKAIEEILKAAEQNREIRVNSVSALIKRKKKCEQRIRFYSFMHKMIRLVVTLFKLYRDLRI